MFFKAIGHYLCHWALSDLLFCWIKLFQNIYFIKTLFIFPLWNWNSLFADYKLGTSYHHFCLFVLHLVNLSISKFKMIFVVNLFLCILLFLVIIFIFLYYLYLFSIQFSNHYLIKTNLIILIFLFFPNLSFIKNLTYLF